MLILMVFTVFRSQFLVSPKTLTVFSDLVWEVMFRCEFFDAIFYSIINCGFSVFIRFLLGFIDPNAPIGIQLISHYFVNRS